MGPTAGVFSSVFKFVSVFCCRYLERMASGLARRAGQEERLLAAAHEAAARTNEAKVSLVALAPKVRAVCMYARACVQGGGGCGAHVKVAVCT